MKGFPGNISAPTVNDWRERDIMTYPMISVIVPVYNVEKYVSNCLDTLLAQTYPNLEIIAVDDGSKDSSGSICDEYAKRHENILVVHKQNAGLGMARNTGLEHVSGEYVTFIDSDDWVEPELIERLYRSLTEKHVDYCKSGFRRVTGDGGTISLVQYVNELFEGKKAAGELLPRMIGSAPDRHDSIEMSVCAVLYNAGIIRQFGLRFPSERELISEDLVFNIDYMQHADGACTIDYVGYLYRQNTASLTHRYRPDRLKASALFYTEMKKKLTSLGYDEMTMLRLSRIFFVYIRMSIAQETVKISGLTRRENLRNIRSICADNIVQEAIRAYPVTKLGLKQRVFIELVRNRCAWLLYALACKGFV